MSAAPQVLAQQERSATVPMFDPQGQLHDVPFEQMHDATTAGGQVAVQMKGPDGQVHHVPANKVVDASKNGGQILPIEQQEVQHQGFWSHALSAAKGVLTPNEDTLASALTVGISTPYTILANMLKGGKQQYQQETTEGRSLPYKAVAQLGPAVGVRIPEMERAAGEGDIGGVAAEAAVPAAMAPLAMSLTKGIAKARVGKLAGEVSGGADVAQPGARAALQEASVKAQPTEFNTSTNEGELINKHSVQITKAGSPVGQISATEETATPGLWLIDESELKPELRGQGVGTAAYKKLFDYAQQNGAKTLDSGGVVSEDAARVWRSLQKSGEPITETESKAGPTFSLDVTKRGSLPAGEAAMATASNSLRESLSKPINTGEAQAKQLYDQIDKASGTDFKALNEKLRNTNDQIRNLTDTEEDQIKEAALEKSRTGLMDKIESAKQQAIEKGVDPKTLDKADAQFKQTQALKDVEAKVFKNPSILKGNAKFGTPETVDVDAAVKALQKLQDSKKFGAPRLEQAFGKEGAQQLLSKMYEAQRNGVHAMKMQQVAKWVAGAAGAAGVAKAASALKSK